MNLLRGLFERRRAAQNLPKSVPPVPRATKREFNKTPEDLQFFLAETFKQAGHYLFPPHSYIAVKNDYPGNLMTFTLRLRSTNGSPVSPAGRILTVDGTSTEGANYLILGTIQMFNGQCRIDMRIDRVETGEILAAGSGMGACDADGVKAAAHAALYGISRVV